MIELNYLTWPDYAIMFIVGLSTLISLIRGFIRDAISLLTWIVAIWIAFEFSSPFSDLLSGFIMTPTLRIMITFALILLIVILVGAIFSYFISKLIHKTGLSGTDRLLGVVFGATRGVLLVGILVLLSSFTTIVDLPAWKHSTLLPNFQGLVNWLRSYVPQSLDQIDVIKHYKAPRSTSQPSMLQIERATELNDSSVFDDHINLDNGDN